MITAFFISQDEGTILLI